jgi:hypothetical protein
MTTYATARAFKNSERLYDRKHLHAPARTLRMVVRTFESVGFRFTGATRWFMDGKPCRVLSFVKDDNTTINYSIRFNA